MKLIADIGATNARFAILEDDNITDIASLPCAEYKTIAEAAKAYLAKLDKKPSSGIFAIASAYEGEDFVKMTNHPWEFSVSETAKELGFDSLKVLNDFEAVAHSISYLKDGDYYEIGEGVPEKNMPIAIIGPGSGLGVASIAFNKDGEPIVVSSEGGHVTIPVSNGRELEIVLHMKHTKYRHVSAERVASGKGLVNLYESICAIDHLEDMPELTAAEISKAAIEKTCPVCEECLDLFCHFLGVVAGNLALTLGSKGGVYLAGGIIPKLGDYFEKSRFYKSYFSHGRFNEYLKKIPIYVIIRDNLALEGLRDF